MVVEFSNSFKKDLERINNRELALVVIHIIEQAKSAISVAEFRNIKKMKSTKNAYRIRAGNYRIGLYVQNNAIVFQRFLHRKDIYKYFP